MVRPWTAIALGVLVVSSPAWPAEPGWDEVQKFESITLYRKEVPGSDVLAYLAEGEVPLPTARLLSLAINTEQKPKWMVRVKKVEVVRQVSETERIEYLHAAVPWPFHDRDFVYSAKVEPDTAAHLVRIRVHSVTDPSRPEVDGLVRGTISSADLEMEPLDGGKRTRVRVEAHVDPSGAIPKWIVNLVQKTMPHKTLEKLKKAVESGEIAADPRAVAWVAQVKRG